ncbi:MAG: hypothetical protein IPP71_04665 [Bacteroidetes bacterium]|nr:hypothetical protein [Bacteroidota bacterium]
MKKYLVHIVMLLLSLESLGQGYNHQWLLGYWNPPDLKGRMLIDNNSYTLLTENRKMAFWGTEANISDSNGNLLMSSNGIWIANATGDTMLNGGGLNPGGVTPNWPSGLPMMANNIFLPLPGDTSIFILLHHTATFNGIYSPTKELFSTLIDLTLDNGLGGITQKNNIVFQDTLNWGVSACRHANGRDWWVVMMKDSSDLVFKILITPAGISSVSTQQLNYLPLPFGEIQLN